VVHQVVHVVVGAHHHHLVFLHLGWRSHEDLRPML
jgi:hypothetical protein